MKQFYGAWRSDLYGTADGWAILLPEVPTNIVDGCRAMKRLQENRDIHRAEEEN